MDCPVNILLVDDEARNLDALETVLEAPGYHLVRAQTANDALIALLHADFAVIVLDIQMPDTSGIELAQIIKQRKATQAIPIIFLTAYYQDEKDVLAGYGTGAVDYLSKPINPQILQSKVAVFVDLFRKTRALSEMNASLAAEVVERQRAQQALAERNLELKQANVAKDRFLANMSHELRTPLNSMLMLAHLFVENHEGNLTARQVEHAKVIVSSGNDLLEIINDVLDLARIEAGCMAIHTSPTALAAVGEAMERMFRQMAQQKGVAFRLTLDDGLPVRMETDSKRVQQILKNLLSNAFKFTQAGAVSLSISRSGDNIVFRVADTGIGIPADRLEVIFEAFHQLDSSLTRNFGGTGLGLSICRQLSRLLGGSMEVESTLGEGSCFSLQLPFRSGSEGGAPAAEPEAAVDARALAGQRVLVVDDDRRTLLAMRSVLEPTGMAVTTVESGADCLAALAGAPRVILLDIMMPGMDGYATLAAIRAAMPGAHIPVIAVTAAAMRGDREKILAAGFDDYLAKPIAPQDLMMRLEHWLTGGQSECFFR